MKQRDHQEKGTVKSTEGNPAEPYIVSICVFGTFKRRWTDVPCYENDDRLITCANVSVCDQLTIHHTGCLGASRKHWRKLLG